MLNERPDPRLAGEVVRYHTWPHIRRQSVGEHSWQVCRILLSIAPYDTVESLVMYAVTHDIGEVRTGDVPYPVKANNPILQDEMNKLESRATEDMLDDWDMIRSGRALTTESRQIFKLAEFIEMWEWACEEWKMGNQFAELVAHRCREAISQYSARVDHVTWRRADKYIDKRKKEWSIL